MKRFEKFGEFYQDSCAVEWCQTHKILNHNTICNKYGSNTIWNGMSWF